LWFIYILNFANSPNCLQLQGVDPKRVNEAVKRNPDKFPEGYVFTLNSNEKTFVVANCDRNSSALKMTRVLPTAFTEKGLYMLATILKSPTATQTTIAIVETFTKLRELSEVFRQLPEAIDENAQKSLMSRGCEIFAEIIDDTVMDVVGNETSLELNLGAFKLKHSVKREKRKL